MTAHDNDTPTDKLRLAVRSAYLQDETTCVRSLVDNNTLNGDELSAIAKSAANLVDTIRGADDPDIMESFLNEYGLSTDEGVALMCLAEALLRVPDTDTVDALIHDKIVPADWGKHLGRSSSSLVNASTWALLLTGKVVADEADGLVGLLHSTVKRLGEPLVRTAVGQAIRELGNQFVLGETIDDALKRSETAITKGYAYSYDMLGEAARTDADARRYHLAYSEAIATLGSHCTGNTVADNPGISVKLSALYPRYEYTHKDGVMVDLVARCRSLAMLARSANMGFNIDAEEADRLDLSLDVIEAVLSEPSLAGWDGFGIVVQSYSRRAPAVLDWLYDLAVRLDRKLMIRLVKGAYWDSEIKQAQVLGLPDFPVFTRKVHTDVSYIVCAQKLLSMRERLYPQFATHNAHTVSAILQMAQPVETNRHTFEFQRLHGMGEALHQQVLSRHGTRCRIYAPVGQHVDLLAYLVRRLLENGANSSFVNQIVDTSVSSKEVAADPFAQIDLTASSVSHPLIRTSRDLYRPSRINSAGININDPVMMKELDQARSAFKEQQWHAWPLLADNHAVATDDDSSPTRQVIDPANNRECVGTVTDTSPAQIERALAAAQIAQSDWQAIPVKDRAAILVRASDLYEQHTAELIALATREAGKSVLDGIAEIREAVDFLRYYASEALTVADNTAASARGTFLCISPWNFPLAIFTGQIAAALVTGNTVIAKPAEQTSLMAMRAVELLHEAGVPIEALQLLPGPGATVGAALTSDARIDGICFTGSTATASLIYRSMAEHGPVDAPLIAETGGLNAMIVDSTALPEQAVVDILASAFQSAGQRCSALRLLLIQSDISDRVITMLKGAMDELKVGNPWDIATDVGPVIDSEAQANIRKHCDSLTAQQRLLHTLPMTAEHEQGTFIAPSVFKLDDAGDLTEEIFGPILHVVEYDAHEFDLVLQKINASGYGLTFGIHTRVDERVQYAVDGIDAGNIYVNRNQIGAVVGSQPFGGKGLSGTGPKAGGPHYLLRFLKSTDVSQPDLPSPQDANTEVNRETNSKIRTRTDPDGNLLSTREIQQRLDRLSQSTPDHQAALIETVKQAVASLPEVFVAPISHAVEHALSQLHATLDLPGPTGESNRLSMAASGNILCMLGISTQDWLAQICQALVLGNRVLATGRTPDARLSDWLHNSSRNLCFEWMEGDLLADQLANLDKLDGVSCRPGESSLRAIKCALASRTGAIVQPGCDLFDITALLSEKTLCIDTTASGGNTSLLALDE